MTVYSVQIAGLAGGVLFQQAPPGGPIVACNGHQVYVFARATPPGRTQVQVYADAALTIPLTQPLSSGSSGQPGAVPGYVPSGISIDIFDQTTGQRVQAEPLNATAVGGGAGGGSSGYWLGVGSSSVPGNGPLGFWPGLGVVYDRGNALDVAVGATSGLLAGVATDVQYGMLPVVILETAAGTLPTGAAITTYANAMVSLIQSVQAAYPGLQVLYEIINEPWGLSGSPTAAQYAAVVVATLNACAAAGLSTESVYAMCEDATWLAGMYSAQPTLQTLVQGWSVHPYGSPPPLPSNDGQGIAGVPALRAQMQSGADNILISEIGFLDPNVNSGTHWSDGAFAAADTSAQAGAWMAATLELAERYWSAGWLKALLVYSRSDGAWATNLPTSGTLTAIGQALASFAQPAAAAVFEVTGSSAFSAVRVWQPMDDLLNACTISDPATASNPYQPVSGAIYLQRVALSQWAGFSGISAPIAVAGSGLTTGENLVGIYDANGELQVTSADQSSNWTSASNTWHTNSTSFTSLAGGTDEAPLYYWVAVLAKGSSPPSFLSTVPSGQSGSTIPNSGYPYRTMRTTATTYTGLPSSLNIASGSVVQPDFHPLLLGF